MKKEKYDDLRGLALDDLRYMTLAQIEERLLVIEYEKPRRIHEAKENPSGDEWDQIMESDEIDHLDVEKAQLEYKRQFILDRRNSWKVKLFWGFVIPIVVSTITAYVVSIFVR